MDNKLFIQKCRQEIGDLKKEIKKLQNELDAAHRRIEELEAEKFKKTYQSV